MNMRRRSHVRLATLATNRRALLFLVAATLFVVSVSAQDAPEDESSGPDQVAVSEAETSEGTLKGESRISPSDAEESTEEGTETEPTFDEIPWKLRPYRVKVSIAYGDAPSFTTHFGEQLTSTLQARIAGVMGPYWQLEVETNNWLLPANSVSLERQSPETLADRFDDIPFDKVLLLCLENEHELTIAGWEWDRNSQSRSPVIRQGVIDRRLIADDVFDLIIDLFRPVAMIDSIEGDTAELLARGGELLAPESVGVMPQSGDLFTPHFRYLTREKEVHSVQSVPWTYLRVDNLERSRLLCGVETAFATALTGSRRRVELMAIRARPVFSETKLRLVPRTNPNAPLVGVRARVYDELPSESVPDPSMEEYMTDRFGTITISTKSSTPMRRLLVHSGGAVLANLPFVAGLESEATLEVPDDAARLEVEGNLAMIEGELIDLVSRRTVMLARALSLAREDEYEEADSTMSAVDQLPGVSYFESKIIAVRVPGVEKAQANRDQAAEKRINKMAADLKALVSRYLDPIPVRDVKAEIRELRQLAERSNS